MRTHVIDLVNLVVALIIAKIYEILVKFRPCCPAKFYGESSIAKMLALVENASQHKAPTQKFITTFASYHTPIIGFISLAVGSLPPLFMPNTDRDYNDLMFQVNAKVAS